MTIQHLVRDFEQRGFVHVPQLFTTQEVGELRDAADAALTAEAGTKGMESAGIVATVDAWEHNAVVRRLALHRRLGSIAEQLAGMPLRVWGGEVLLKRGNGGRPTGLHDDQTSELLNSRVTLTAWVALVDVPVERGCLTFLPGSHRRGGRERIDLTGINLSDLVRDDARSYLFDYWPELRWVPRVTVPVRAGDATFHHRRIAHSAGANLTPDDRVSVAVTFTDADAAYQPIPGTTRFPTKRVNRFRGSATPALLIRLRVLDDAAHDRRRGLVPIGALKGFRESGTQGPQFGDGGIDLGDAGVEHPTNRGTRRFAAVVDGEDLLNVIQMQAKQAGSADEGQQRNVCSVVEPVAGGGSAWGWQQAMPLVDTDGLARYSRSLRGLSDRQAIQRAGHASSIDLAPGAGFYRRG